MCFKCSPGDIHKLTYREVPIKLLRKVQEAKGYIRSNGETITNVEWALYNGKNYVAWVTYEFSDGYQIHDDMIQVTV